MRWTILSLPLFLGGCFVPLPLTIASLSLSGAAYIDSGKTMPEHALSAATSKDCSLFRAIGGNGPVCQDEIGLEPIITAGGPDDAPLEEVAAAELRYPGCETATNGAAWSQCVGLEL